jgi:hypothetical protein
MEGVSLMFGLSKIMTQAIGGAIIIGLLGSAILWLRADARSDVLKELAIKAATSELENVKTEKEISDAVEATPDEELINRIIDGGWLLTE